MGWAVLLCLSWFWSDDIGADQPWPPDEPPAAVAALPTAKPGAATVPGGTGLARRHLPLDPDANIDRRAFLAAFQRQAQAALLPCLRAWEAPPNELAVTAIMDKGGHLLHLSSLDPTRPAPDCAVAAIAAMSFPAAAASLRHPAVSLQWRLDW